MSKHKKQDNNKAPYRAKRTVLLSVVLGCAVVIIVVLAVLLVHFIGG